MGIMARLLGWIWRRWADYNLVVALLDVLDWKTGLSALIGGALMTFFGATNTNWSPQFVLLVALIAAACVALVVIAMRFVFRPGMTNGPNVAHPMATAMQGAQIIFGTGHPFETVAPSGNNRNRTVRVKIQNNTDAEISNGRVDILNLDPPNKGSTHFQLKDGIIIGARKHTFVDVAAYGEGTSMAEPWPWIRLLVPTPGGYLFNGLPGDLPLTPHTFHLRFSTLEEGSLDEVYCRFFVYENHILRLADWGRLSKAAQYTNAASAVGPWRY